MKCLITGGAGALGSDLARWLVARGDDVLLVDRPQSKARVEALTTELGSRVTFDFLEEGTLAAYEALVARAGSIDGAALIAGGWAGGAPIHEASRLRSDGNTRDDVYSNMMHANTDTVYFALRSLLPGMVARKRGSIVVVGSRNVARPWTGAGSAAYTASKAAAVALAEVAAAEVLEYGVRINAVLPSTMDTPANRTSMPKVDPSRWVRTSSAAGVIGFLLGEDARDISGAAIPVYGRA